MQLTVAFALFAGMLLHVVGAGPIVQAGTRLSAVTGKLL